jgi:adenylyltransferase/sulfurtransferase
VISGAGEPAVGRLLLYDALTLQWRSVNFSRDRQCAVCGDSGKAD